MSETFADRLKMLREKNNWSKAETARKLEVSGGAYSNWEYGNRKPSLEFTKKIADLFDVSTNYLLEGKYMIRDIHIMPESQKKEVIEEIKYTGKEFSNNIAKNLSEKLKNINSSNLTIMERYFLDQAINFMINYSDINDEKFLTFFGALFRNLNNYYSDLNDENATRKEKVDSLDFYNDDLSEFFSDLTNELYTYFKNGLDK